MTDNMRFVPDKIDVKQGETVRIKLRNEGKMLHEFVIGTRKELDEHAASCSNFRTWSTTNRIWHTFPLARPAKSSGPLIEAANLISPA